MNSLAVEEQYQIVFNSGENWCDVSRFFKSVMSSKRKNVVYSILILLKNLFIGSVVFYSKHLHIRD